MKFHGRPRRSSNCAGESRTVQEPGSKITAMSILKSHAVTASLQMNDQAVPRFGEDNSHVALHDALTMVREAETMYANLPSSVRDASHQDPVEFLAMAHDPEGWEILSEACPELFPPLEAQPGEISINPSTDASTPSAQPQVDQGQTATPNLPSNPEGSTPS